MAADKIVPFDRRIMIEPEPPVGRDAVGRWGVIGFALVDRRQLAPEQDLALDIQLFRRFITGIDPAIGAQPLEFLAVNREPLGLADRRSGVEPEPVEIGNDRLDMLLAAALEIGVVDAQQKPPAALRAKQIIMQRGADIADVQAPGRRRGKAGGDHWPNRVTDSAAAAAISRRSLDASGRRWRRASSRYAASYEVS